MTTAQFISFLLVLASGSATVVIGIHLRALMRDPDSLPMQRDAVANAFITAVLGFLSCVVMVFLLQGPSP